MTFEEQDFLVWYKAKFSRNDPELPCLKCPDEKILVCSNLKKLKAGCVEFKKYQEKTTYPYGSRREEEEEYAR